MGLLAPICSFFGKCTNPSSRVKRRRHLSSSSRILVAVKSVSQTQSLLKLLFSEALRREDYVVFLHVTDGCSVPALVSSSISEAIRKFVLRGKATVPKMTITILIVQAFNVCDAIVEEARRIRATMVLLGRSHRVGRSMHENERTCVSKLPRYCLILIIRKGKVVELKTGRSKSKKRSLVVLFEKQKSHELSLSYESVCQEDSAESLDTFFLSSISGKSSFTVSSPDSISESFIDRKCYSSSSSDVDDIKRFAFEELVAATNNFGNMIGSGGCCSVFNGILSDGSRVAVKKLQNGTGGHREFFREIKVISYIRHKNLLPLLGFCDEDSRKLLVYELMENGSLHDRLHATDEVLPWKLRQQIALDAARGLRHLHELSPHHVIHQDVKSSNILLNRYFKARLSDFEFARWSNELNSTCSGLVGTFGYMAPEYLVHGVATEKTDVYSFGVVLLEMISGKCPIDSTLPTKKQSIVHWAVLLEKTGETYKLVDPRLRDVEPYPLKKMLYAALQCIRFNPEERPNMRRLVSILDPQAICSEPLLLRHEP